jgi:hypothetical protein
MNEFYQGVVRPCDSLKCEGKQKDLAVAAPLLRSCCERARASGRRLEQGGSRSEEQWLARPPVCRTVRLPAARTRCRVRIS